MSSCLGILGSLEISDKIAKVNFKKGSFQERKSIT